jgi:anti-anti-sigma regulatory factor
MKTEIERLREENERLRARVSELESAPTTRGEVSDHDAVELLVSVIGAVSAQREFGGALGAAIREICARTGWTLGEAWVPQADGTLAIAQLRSTASADHARLRSFVEQSERLTLAVGEGLVGRVFATRAVEWVQDVVDLPTERYRRLEHARSAGLHAAVGVPVLAGDSPIAVLAFYMDAPRPTDPRRIELIAAVAAQLGLALQKKRAEERVERLETEVLERSTPVLEIWEGVGLAPVVGDLDARRVAHLQNRVLAFLEQRRVRSVLVDLTAVPEIDSYVAKELIALSKGVRMLGARATFTGLRPALARALVHLGVSFEDVRSASTLAAGLRSAVELG